MISILFHEFLNSTGRVNQFLLSCKERMTGRTNLYIHLSVHRPKLYFIPAGTLGGNFMVFGVDIFFHAFSSIRCATKQYPKAPGSNISFYLSALSGQCIIKWILP